MKRCLAIAFLSLLAPEAFPRSPETTTAYVLAMSRGGSDTLSFLARLETVGRAYHLVSDVQPDIILEPLSGPPASEGTLEGRFTVSLTDHRFQTSRLPVEVTMKGAALLVRGLGLSLDLTPIGIPAAPDVLHWRSPFKANHTSSASDFKKRIISRYGANRTSEKRGHRHAGVDLRGNLLEPVYPIGPGLVLSVSNKHPESAAVIEHRLSAGSRLYSKYVHFGAIIVVPGEIVDEKTPLGRLFSEKEFHHSGFQTAHLHLEIRKSYADKGRASSRSMSMKELNAYCMDPVDFMKARFD